MGKYKATIFLSVSFGHGARYLLRTNIVRVLHARGFRLIALVPNPESNHWKKELGDHIKAFERLETSKIESYRAAHKLMAISNYLSMFGVKSSARTPALDDIQDRWENEFPGFQSFFRKLLRPGIWLLGRSRILRSLLKKLDQAAFHPAFHEELFRKYQPDLLITTSPGWWLDDRIIIREAKQFGTKTLALITGWDNATSRGFGLSPVDHVCVWSSIMRDEYQASNDFLTAKIHITGPAHFDQHFKKPAENKKEFYKRLKLDPDRRLITYICSFTSLTPTFHIIDFLAQSVIHNNFDVPCQLMIRLHPVYFKPHSHTRPDQDAELQKILALANSFQQVSINFPTILSSENNMTAEVGKADMDDLAGIMEYSDVIVTIFSTMTLEAAIHNTPVVCTNIDPPASWPSGRPTLKLTKATFWPTHQRIIKSNAFKISSSYEQLLIDVNGYLKDRHQDKSARQAFVRNECTFINGECGKRTADLVEEIVCHEMKITTTREE